MVFYPKGGTWSNSPVIVYGRAVPVTHAMTIKSQVEQTVSDFHKNGSPNYSSKAKPSLALPNGRKAEIYYYAGDRGAITRRSPTFKKRAQLIIWSLIPERKGTSKNTLEIFRKS